MARALLGYVGNSSEQALAFEVRRLRRRVAELEAELVELRATQLDSADHAALDLELHRIASSAAPALA